MIWKTAFHPNGQCTTEDPIRNRSTQPEAPEASRFPKSKTPKQRSQIWTRGKVGAKKEMFLFPCELENSVYKHGEIFCRQPSQRLTARQQARQERLLQGIQQTQWNDMRLPRGLDLRHKAKKELLSEEQHLRRVKAAEVRRVQTQKAKRDTMEITKARIRAASSNKFRDILSNSTNEKTKVKSHFLKLDRGFLDRKNA